VQQAGPPVALEVASVVRRDTCPVGGRVRTAAALLWVQSTSREPALFFSTLARSTRPRRALPPSRGALPFTLCPGAPFPRPSPHIAPPIPATPEPAAPPSLSRLSSGRSPRALAVRPSSVPRGASSWANVSSFILVRLLLQPPSVPARGGGKRFAAPAVDAMLGRLAHHVEQPVMACGGRGSSGLGFLGVCQDAMKHRCGSALLI